MEEELTKHIDDLKKRAETKHIYTYTSFLSPSEQQLAKGATLFGGADFAERKIARFGNDISYEETPPIAVLQIKVIGIKFEKQITHRDILGAIMNTGVERDKVGDIFVGEDTAYIVVVESIAEHIERELVQVARCRVDVQTCESVPDDFAPKKENKTFTVNTARADSIVAGVYNLSREKSAVLFDNGKVSINGNECNKASKELHTGDIVSVRGFGKFVFNGESGTSRKGKTYVSVDIYK